MKNQLTRILAASVILALPGLLTASPGEELWMKNCKKCHGDAGKGDTPMGQKFGVRDYTSAEVQASLTDEAIKSAIVDGKADESGKKLMLAFGKKLSDEEVAALVAYMRSLANE